MANQGLKKDLKETKSFLNENNCSQYEHERAAGDPNALNLFLKNGRNCNV